MCIADPHAAVMSARTPRRFHIEDWLGGGGLSAARSGVDSPGGQPFGQLSSVIADGATELQMRRGRCSVPECSATAGSPQKTHGHADQLCCLGLVYKFSRLVLHGLRSVLPRAIKPCGSEHFRRKNVRLVIFFAFEGAAASRLGRARRS